MNTQTAEQKQLARFLSAPDLPPFFGVSKIQRVCGIGYNWASRTLELGLSLGNIEQVDTLGRYKLAGKS